VGKDEPNRAHLRFPSFFPQITRPNSTITWTICPDSTPNATFYCHFLPLPLDYEEEESNEKAIIAMRMFPSTVDESERLGSLFTNPGGVSPFMSSSLISLNSRD